MEDYQTDRFRRIVGTIVRAEVRMVMGRTTIPALIDVITGIGFFAVLMLAGQEITEDARTTGDFMAFFTAMALTFQPLRRLGDMTGVWQIAAASLERIYRLFDTAPATRPRHSLPAPPPVAPEIRLEDVHFAYGELAGAARLPVSSPKRAR